MSGARVELTCDGTAVVAARSRWASRDPQAWRARMRASGYLDGHEGRAACHANRYYRDAFARGQRDHERELARALR